MIIFQLHIRICLDLDTAFEQIVTYTSIIISIKRWEIGRESLREKKTGKKIDKRCSNDSCCKDHFLSSLIDISPNLITK